MNNVKKCTFYRMASLREKTAKNSYLVLLLTLVSNFVMVSMVNEERHEMREGLRGKQCKESL